MISGIFIDCHCQQPIMATPKELSTSHAQTLQEGLGIQQYTLSPYVQALINQPELKVILAHNFPQHGYHERIANVTADVKRCMESVISHKDMEADMQNEQYYQNAVNLVAPQLQNIYSIIQSSHDDNCSTLNSTCIFKWLNIKSSDLEMTFWDARSECREIRYSTCLCLTSLLERGLQDLHMTQFGHTPTMFKELLRSPDLRVLLGDELMTFLDIVLGPPTSLNIRNLVWHGFGAADMGEPVEQYSVIIIFIMHWVGTVLVSKDINPDYRPFQSIDVEFLKSHHPVLLETVQNIAVGSFPSWAKPSDLKQCLSFASKGDYGRAVMLLLVTFEHIMRVAFCHYNDCSSRQMTAVQSEYFTTLDHILEEYISDGSTENKLYRAIPDHLRTALSDLLYYPDGLRLRDRLSHMEISPFDIDGTIWNFACHILNTTINHVLGLGEMEESGKYILTSYSPVYHPLSILFRTVEQCQNDISAMKDIVIPGTLIGNIECAILVDPSSLDQLEFKFKTTEEREEEMTLDNLLFDTGLGQSSKFKRVVELCKLLQSLAEIIHQCATLLSSFHEKRLTMLEDKSLRSRQRKNYLSFLSLLPSFVSLLQGLLSTVTRLRSQMALQEKGAVVGKSHKNLLQLTENLHSYFIDCKWSQSVDYFVGFVKTKFNRNH